jgi:hypothetical protein
MIKLQDYLEAVGYRITEGSEYGWSCYGPNAHRLDAWNGDHNGVNASVTFDTETQTVYEATVYDYAKPAAYRLINPKYLEQYRKEAKKRKVDPDQAWDEVNYTDLEVDEDFIEKAHAIMAGLPYDNKVSMPLVLEDDQLFDLMKLAHAYDMSLNQFVEHILQHYVDEGQQDKSKPAAMTASNKKRRREKAV